MDDNKILYLPWPPTINSYYSSGYGHVKYISAKGRIFRNSVIESINEQLPGITLRGKLYVECILHPPDKRRRDLDNYSKALLDAITAGGLWEDDSQIDQLTFLRGNQVQNGCVRIEIGPAGPVIPFRQ